MGLLDRLKRALTAYSGHVSEAAEETANEVREAAEDVFDRAGELAEDAFSRARRLAEQTRQAGEPRESRREKRSKDPDQPQDNERR